MYVFGEHKVAVKRYKALLAKDLEVTFSLKDISLLQR